MPPTRRRGPRRSGLVVTGIGRLQLQLGPATPPMPPPTPGAWAAGDREVWRAVRAELPREQWPSWEAFWALHPGIPDELRLLPGLQAYGPEHAGHDRRRREWLVARGWPWYGP